SPMRSQMPSGWPSSSSRDEEPVCPLSSTANRTRVPSEATRWTCDAMGTDSAPANSRGSSKREYCDGKPVSGRAKTDPACQNTEASASDSLHRYVTALPSRNSTAWRAPMGRPAPSGPGSPASAAPPMLPAVSPAPSTGSADRCTHGDRGPMRNSVPCRSGGSAPSMGSDACSMPITTAPRSPRRCQEHSPSAPRPTPATAPACDDRQVGPSHAAGQPTGVWQSRRMRTLSEDLAFRGLIHQKTDPSLPKRLDESGLTVYAGFDPSADSLHVGNLLQLCTLRRFQEAGHRPISLAGGGTGMIGDPGGKQDERQLLDLATIAGYVERIRPQLGQFLDLERALLLNNADWLSTLSTLEYLRDVG